MKKINWTFMAIALGMFCVFNLSCTKSEEPQPGSPKTGSEEPEKSSVQNKEVSMAMQQVKLQTTMGDIVIELDEEKAPVTVKNFLGYVERGFYEGTIFHRVISGFMIQGGGLTEDMQKKSTEAAIINEGSNGLKNDRGTIAMARTGHPDSATAQFFISVVNNDSLNYTGPGNPGYAVFGKVVEGMDVVDKIAAVKTTRRGSADVPVEPVIINGCSLIED